MSSLFGGLFDKGGGKTAAKGSSGAGGSLFGEGNKFRRDPVSSNGGGKPAPPAPALSAAPAKAGKGRSARGVKAGDDAAPPPAEVPSILEKREKEAVAEDGKQPERKKKAKKRKILEYQTDSDDEGDEDGSGPAPEKERDPEELEKTVFVGNLPAGMKQKKVAQLFKPFGKVSSVRLRSVAIDQETKMPRKGAVETGKLNPSRSSMHAYVVFDDTGAAKAALKLNMTEVDGKHIRVDGAAAKEKSREFDKARSVFVGNLAYDVEDEDLIAWVQNLGNSEKGGLGEGCLEAVRIVRDPKTGLGKGFAFLLFTTKSAFKAALKLGEGAKMGDRKLRITRVSDKPPPSKTKKLAKAKPPSVGGGNKFRKTEGGGRAPGGGEGGAGGGEKKSKVEDWMGTMTKGKTGVRKAAGGGTGGAGGGDKLVKGKKDGVKGPKSIDTPRKTGKRPAVQARKLAAKVKAAKAPSR